MLTEEERARLAARLRRRTAGPDEHELAPRRDRQAEVPLSYAQEQLWFLDRFAPGRSMYNVPSRLRLTGPLDPTRLSSALAGVLARHESLRSTFVADDSGRPRQQVTPTGSITLAAIELTEAELDRFGVELARQPFDLTTGPLYRFGLVRLAEDDHVLVMVFHHSVFDAWSYGILVDELRRGYAGESVPPPPIQFADYAVWERSRPADATGELVGYWQQHLAGFENLRFPTDQPRPALESFRGEVRRINLGIEVRDQVRALSAQAGCTPFVVVFAALLAVLRRYTRQDDLIVGTPSANRGRAKLQALIGYLVNTLPIRVDLSGDPTFLDLLSRVRQATVAGYAHQDLPLARLVEAVGVERDPGRAPIFQVMLTYAEAPEPVKVDDLCFGLEKVDLPAAKLDLAFLAEAAPDGLWLETTYALDLFSTDRIDRLLGHYEQLLTGALADPSLRVSELPLLTEAELFDELVSWNDVTMPVGPDTLIELIRRHDGVAAVHGATQLGYTELIEQAERMAGWLLSQVGEPGRRIGIALPPSLRRIVLVVGCHMAGCAYVPLDPSLPPDRLAFLLADAEPALVLSDGTVAGIDLDQVWESIQAGPRAEPVLGTPTTPAYVIYTSGSTGQPKGVVVEQAQVLNFVLALQQLIPAGPGERVLQFASLSFDVSVLDLFLTLVTGATAIVAEPDVLYSPPRLAALMRQQRVSITSMPPAVLGLLTDEHFPDLHVLISAGEQLPDEVARAWLRPGLRLFNGYGPTETTVLSLIEPVDGLTWPVPIGRTLANYQSYVLDDFGNPVPVGVPGELHTGGESVARGYLNRPELTAERFLDDPYRPEPGGRLYRTGDLVSRLPDGRIRYLGRLDDQVQLRGLRVELGEIEAALVRCDGVAQAVAAVRDGELLGYLRADGAALDEDGVRRQLAAWLPRHMVPSRFVLVAEFPRNASNKIDRRRLPAPDRPAPDRYTPPDGPVEAALCAVFGELLDREQPVSATQNFFSLGGNSLQAMAALAAIRRRTGLDLAVTDLFLAPTPRELATRAAAPGGSAVATAAALLRLNEVSGPDPVVLVHAVGGTVFPYRPLAHALPAPVIGLESPGLHGPIPVEDDLAGLAGRYLELLRSRQPRGPYRLAGWSFGALVAHLMAGRLVAQGDTVARLVLLDPPFEVRVAADAEAAFVADVLAALGRTEKPPASDRFEWLVELLGPDARDMLSDRFRVFQYHQRLMTGYRPSGVVAVPAVVVNASRSPNAGTGPDWRRVLPGARLLAVDADHYGVLAPDQVAGWF